VTDRLAARVIALPTGAAISEEEIQTVCELVRLASVHAVEISAMVSRGFPAGVTP
jgi:dTDP-4-amino-4,6-dideoxyglucose